MSFEQTMTANTNTTMTATPNVSTVQVMKKWAQSTPLLRSLIEVPLFVIMSFIINHIAFHIDRLTLTTSSKDVVVTMDHIYIQSSLNVSQRQPSGKLFQDHQQRVFTVQMQVGPVVVADTASKSLVEMTTTCLVIVSCQLNRIVLEYMDLDIQLGIINMYMDSCIAYYQRHQADQQQSLDNHQQDLDMSASRFMRLGIMINSISVTVQKMNMENQHIALRMEANALRIQVQFQHRMEPCVQLNTEQILLCLHQHHLIEIPTMKMTATLLPPEDDEQHSSRDHYASSDSLPHTDLLSVTWIINMPLLTLPLKSQTFLDTLARVQQLQQPTTNTTTTTTTNNGLPQKKISNVPACSLAIVLNSAKMDLLDVDNDERHGYMSSKSLIVRFSGEYMKKSNRNSSSSFDDVPSSSSSSSASRFDSWFAQEEYRWLSGGSSSSSLTARNRSSFHESTSKSKSTTPTPPQTPTPAARWLYLLGRVSRRRQSNNSNNNDNSSNSTPLVRPQQRHQNWIYRLSLKVIMQHVKFGYQCDQQAHDFIRVKHAVFIFKSGMHVVQNQVVFTPGNVIQSEAAIEKPLINVWDTHNSTAISASVFWLTSVPEALQSFKGNSSNNTSNTDWKQVVVQSISFSLDVTQGSIVAYSVDIARPPGSSQAPPGFIDNAPPHTVYTRMILDTQKLTFVCEGPYATVDQHFQNEWKTRCHVEKLYIHQSSSCMQHDMDIYELLQKPEKQHVILWISQLNFTTTYWQATMRLQLSVAVKVKKFGIAYSIRNHYACLLLFRSLLIMKNQLQPNDVDSDSGLKHQQSTATAPMPLVSLDVSVGRGDVQIVLPQETKLYLRMDELTISHVAEQQNMIQIRNIMLLGASPTHHAKWEQLVELDQIKIAKTSTAIELKAKKILASVPYKFVLSEVIDSVIGIVKAVKELHARIQEQDPARRVFTCFGPSLKNDPIAIPHIKLRAKVFTIHFDDDPFEARLRNILKTGLQEQQRRLAYKEALDEKVYDMLHTATSASPESASASSWSMRQQTSVSDDVQSIQTTSSTINPQRDDTGNASPNVGTAASDNTELYAQIVKAQQSLLEYYSGFWIKHINEANQQETQFFETLHLSNNYRNTATSDTIDQTLDDGDSRRHDRFLLSKTFTIDIVPRPLHPPLANFTAQYAKVSFKPANFRLEETRSFIHMVGNGVPLDYDFSILIPFHLSIKASKTWIKVRDYPLPLLYVPPSEKGRVAWTLEGDYVVGDELGNSGGSRTIPITIVPASSSAPGYCLSAVRTASPLKFYSVVDYHVLTQGMSMICWSISYNPAIQDILRVLDTLTAAQVDPSPRIGFWDKVRFMIHSQIKIHFTGGGKLAFVVKGTRDPYQLLERGAGLAKIWSDDVVWLLGYENEQNEFMQIISQSYAFGVPDLIHGGFVPQLPDSLQHKQEKMCADDSRVFLKIALKLSDGVRMGIGLSYERLSCHGEDVRNDGLCDTCQSQHPHMIDRCRSQVFMPHYYVLFQSIQQVNTHVNMATYDAFRGFRSDFIHLSFSIVKLENDNVSLDSPDFSQDDPYLSSSGNVSQNAMYLSPCFVTHFQQWFRLFGSPISIPIRQGKLFPTAEMKAKSFGELLDTIKYKIVVNPLAIGFFISDQETYLNMKGGGSVGLKARVNSFSVDLHSRREMIRPNDAEAVPDDSLKTEINFHEAEVELSDIDLRVIRAHHRSKTNTASTVAASKAQSAKSVAESTAYSEDHSYQGQEASFSGDESHASFQWIDAKDFVILDAVHKQPFLSRSKIDVFPFAFSPLFYYIKQHDEPGAEKRDYLRRTHECTIGNGMDSHEFQKTYLNQRAADLDKVIESHDKQLDIIIHAMSVYRNKSEDLTDEHDFLVKKIDHLRIKRYMLHTYIAQIILESELNMTTEDADTRGSPHTTTSSICRKDELNRWEMLMGRFKDRYFVHNPQIIWNSSVRDAVYYMRDIYNHRSVQSLNLSARCFKFLEDLVKMAEKQQQWKPDVPAAATEASPSPTASSVNTQALIDKLLAERTKNFIAYNEREEDKKQPKENTSSPSSNTSFDGIHMFDGNSDNVNDPDYQYENIPDLYEMQSNYLVDMINPQFICQSERGHDHLILLTNERIHIKGFCIIDNSTSGAADKDVRLVKSRIIANLDNAQLLVARKIEEVHSYHALAPNCYGQFQERHWAVWAQPEQLWYYRELKHFENFQRIATQLSGTMQLDLYNHLRIKINKYNNTLRKSPFEDRTNTIQLHFPHVKLTLNSLQSHILYYTVTHLLLASDRSPREKTKLNKFHDVMLAAERSDLAETVKQVGVLQNRSRHLLELHSRFLSELPYLDAFGLREFNKNKKKMSESLEKLYMVVEAIRSIQTFRRDIHLEESDSAKRFVFTSDEIIWEAIMDNEAQSSLCEWKLINTKYVRLDKPNGSHKNTVEVDQFQIKNTTESPVFVNVLDAYIAPSDASHQEPDFSRHKMLSGVLDSLPPVGGIPVIQHLEINLMPLHLQISTAFGTAMKDYFFPRLSSTTTSMSQQDQEQHIVFSADEYEEEDEGDDEAVVVDSLNVARTNSYHASVHSFGKREGSFASLDMIAKKVKDTVVRKRKGKADELTIMKKRSSTNRTFIYVRIPAAKHCISFQGPTQSTFYNLYNFPFKQPKLEYRNKTWSVAEMTEEIQKQFVKAILRHSPALLKKKLLTKNSRELPAPAVPVSRLISVKSKQSSSTSLHSNIDLMDDSVIYNENDDTTSRTKSVASANTEEDDLDVQSLYSNAPEEEQQQLAELQTIKRKASHNVDEVLLDFYATKHKPEQTPDELTRNSQILFGSSYH